MNNFENIKHNQAMKIRELTNIATAMSLPNESTRFRVLIWLDTAMRQTKQATNVESLSRVKDSLVKAKLALTDSN